MPVLWDDDREGRDPLPALHQPIDGYCLNAETVSGEAEDR